MFRQLGLFFILSFLCTRSFASFEGAIKLYQDQKYAEAEQAFRTIEKSELYTPGGLYNWGLAAYRSGQKGLGVALWRRALDLNPNFSRAERALDLAARELPEDIFSFGEGFIAKVKYLHLRGISLTGLLIVHFLLFVFSTWLMINYFLKRRESLRDEEPLPPTPTLGVLFSLMLVVVSGLVALRYSLEKEPRATVIVDNLSLKTAAEPEANDIYKTISGMEFKIDRVSSGWVFLSRPDGMTGWARVDQVFQTSGASLW